MSEEDVKAVEEVDKEEDPARTIMDAVAEIDEGDGAPYDTLIAKTEHIPREVFDEVVATLLEDGHLVEPNLGTMSVGKELEGLPEDVKEDLEKLEAKEKPKQETFEVEKVQGQVTLSGQQVRIHVSHDGGTTKTTYKFTGGEGKLSISDAEYRKRCMPVKGKKGKMKKAEISPRVLVVRKLRFPGITHTPQGDEYSEYVDAFEADVKAVFKNMK